MSSALTLAAEDAADLEIISARLQDAVAQMKDLVYLPKKRRFAALFNRFVWESDEKRGDLRVRSGLHFEGVLSVKSHKLKRGAPDAVVFSPQGFAVPIEIKTPKGKLRARQVVFHQGWRGPEIRIVRTIEDVIEMVR